MIAHLVMIDHLIMIAHLVMIDHLIMIDHLVMIDQQLNTHLYNLLSLYINKVITLHIYHKKGLKIEK